MGDFNTPLLVFDKLGGLPPNVESRQHLADLIRDLALLDVDPGHVNLPGPIGELVWSTFR